MTSERLCATAATASLASIVEKRSATISNLPGESRRAACTTTVATAGVESNWLSRVLKAGSGSFWSGEFRAVSQAGFGFGESNTKEMNTDAGTCAACGFAGMGKGFSGLEGASARRTSRLEAGAPHN